MPDMRERQFKMRATIGRKCMFADETHIEAPHDRRIAGAAIHHLRVGVGGQGWCRLAGTGR